MLGAGGLKMGSKRTAFGDVSNTVKNISAVHDDLVTIGKTNGYDVVEKPYVPQEKSAAFLRPAQRPLAGLKGFLPNNSLVNPVAAPSTAKAPVADTQQPLVKSRTLSKRNTTIFKDSTALESSQAPQPATQSVSNTNALVAPVHQNLGPRQHKSQPQLKVDQPALRRTQSKIVENPSEEAQEDPAQVGSVQPDASEQHSDQVEKKKKTAADIRRENQQAEELAIEIRQEIDRQERQLPAPPLVSEPEEYWEEEEEEELYDEQGYTTAHSYRSRGDNTTGGATTVLFPKVTNKVKKELALAKDIVESSRTAEEIEDEQWDTSMVAEYGDEIFHYMRELEVCPFLFGPSLVSFLGGCLC
jgi:hypothetical protein